MEEHGGHSYKSFVRGVPINFSVMRFKAQVEGARTDFETRKEHDQQLDSVLTYLCMPGATWKLSTGQQRVPIQLRRQELNPIARGWHELSIHSLIPSSNRSEIPVIRAILIHCIMNGEDVRAEEIIAYKMQPPLYEVPTYTDQHEKDLHSIEEQLKNMMWYQQQCLENINKSQVEYMVELRTIKGKQQEMYENNDRFYNQVREEQREMAKEIQQVKNYQVNQTMVESARNKANPNLVEMPVHKVTKQIYDNANNNRPMFYGFLKSDLPPSKTALPPPKSKDPYDAPN
ncbi:hypothetical protein PIB30_072942 [Stylosanthes scabra]|uniref:Putative plant transposon protein domain-containing protein n=1 Tax=Stylosanthes scabra TaxID=79078 RepID=A0ABU6TPZ0_9FABA|nr:hypothetical protein [Stylosanthes scabra]